MKIGIGITTHNRRDVLMKTLKQFKKFMPEGAKLVIVDDASDDLFPTKKILNQFKDICSEAYVTVFLERQGVARAKNACLTYLNDCDHIFLFDDDTYPIARDWWKHYVDSKEPHLMYQFKLPGKPKDDMRELYRDNEIVAYSHTRGAMLYVDRRVLDVVGGMDTEYGVAMFEHADWTNRIHNAGLTTHRAMDVPSSDKLLYCLDQDKKVESSIPAAVRRLGRFRNSRRYRKSKFSKEYKEY